LAVMAIVPAWAAAAPPPFVDDTAADFGAGTLGGGASLVAPGSVQLSPVEQFDGAGLPLGMTAAPPSAASVGAGTLKVNAGRVAADRFSGPGQVLQFSATFAAGEGLQHLGFGDTLDDNQPWAIFSTGDGTGLFARARTAAGPEAVPIRIAAFDAPAVLGAPHVYRIEWTATAVNYFVDGTQVATQDVAISAPMRPIVSDFTDNLAPVTVDSVSLLSGDFQSRVLDARDDHAAWGALTPTVVKPAGTDVTGIETRSGQTATPDATWSAYQPLGTGGAIQSPSARYIQYRAKLSTTDALVTPSLDSVQIAYDDTTGPATVLSDVQVSGTDATATFSSAAVDLAHFECKLDGGAFAACTSPKALSGVAPGSHTLTVHGVDALGNVGPDASKTFTIASPPATGGGGQAGGTGGTGGTSTTQQSGTTVNSAADKSKPKVSVVAKSLKASKKGAVSFTVGCPATEQSCKITLKLKNGKKIAASRTVNVMGGKSKTVTLTLDKATKKLLAKRHTLKVSTVVTAVDAAGNKRTTTKQATLRRAAG
jgi:hypothetical protein